MRIMLYCYSAQSLLMMCSAPLAYDRVGRSGCCFSTYLTEVPMITIYSATAVSLEGGAL